MTIEERSINTIRTLAMDAVEKAKSGHPGTAMALAPLAYVLWTRFLRFNPANPRWFNRDRFVLSNGHASMLLYAVLHLSGYDLSLEDIRNFRQWGSKTPGHPEYDLVPGVETTTGPLGQGCMVGVGMAMAEAHLGALYNRPGHEIVDHATYVLCGDGDLMEGASHEAASMAGHLGLGKLIYLYDDNRITIEGSTELTYSEDVARRFESYDWHVQDIGDRANDLDALTRAIRTARDTPTHPSLIIIRSHIGYGAPNLQDTPEAHGAPLGVEEIKLTKRFYRWPEDEHFLVPDSVREHMQQPSQSRGAALEKEWLERFDAYRKDHPGLAAQFDAALKSELPAGWDGDIPTFQPDDGPMATRSASGKIINALSSRVPWLVGGSADLAPSTNTLIKDSGYLQKGDYLHRNVAWGIREHVMCAASCGMALHGGVRPFGATFFVFSDYARPAIRLAALMKTPVIYVMTHDSIGIGEDGPTHQPVEHLPSLRAMPNLCVIRPADANETAQAWRIALARQDGPTMIVLSRQKLPILAGSDHVGAPGAKCGAYVLSREGSATPDIILIASGSEVQLILEAQERLAVAGIEARVVSMPSWELFRQQPQRYRDEVLPPAVTDRLAVEAGSSQGWREWIGSGSTLGIDDFGASAPAGDIFKHYGMTVEAVVSKAIQIVNKTD
jgi:transketolase